MTSRGRWFLGAAFVFYMFANQTQIGWLYVIAALLVGLVLAAGVLNRGAARGIRVQRVLSSGKDGETAQPLSAESSLYETDLLALTLMFSRDGLLPAVQVSITHICPLADPESDAYKTTLYVPMLTRESPLQYGLTFPVYQRGVHRFPPIEVSSAAPFGFFQQKRLLAQPDPQVVYPEYRPLTRFPFLDRRDVADQTRPHVGRGSEVLGVRPYRPGDLPRHIHWQSVARTGQLVSKEFAEESQPRVALVLDRRSPEWPPNARPDAPFEILVKALLSVGDYALRRGFTVTLHADETDLAHPYGPLTNTAMLEYLARVAAQEDNDLAAVLAQVKQQGPTFVILLTACPERLPQAELIGFQSLLIVMTPPADEDTILRGLPDLGVTTCILPTGEDWAVVLSQTGSPS